MLEVNDYAVAYYPSAGVAVTTNARLSPNSAIPSPSTPVLDHADEDGNMSQEIALWGVNNDLPQQIIADVEANPELASTLHWSAKALISGGIVYGYVETDEATGKETMRTVQDPVVEAWLSRTNIKKYLRHAAKDYYVLWHVFTEFMKSNDGTQIAAIACQDTSYCRFGLQDEKGRMAWAYLCANWTRATASTSTGVTKFPLLDPDFDVQTQLEFSKFNRFIYPTSGTATGRTYYQPAPWHSLRTSGWLELANAIPRFKKALLKNQFTIKYHVQIAEWWWKMKYPDWEQFPLKKRERVAAELKAFNDKMAGTDNAGNSILTMMKVDEESGKTYEGWKITPIEDKLQDGKYIEDSQEACSHIFFGVGVDPTLIGAAPGKGQGAGSGSDKRVAQNIWTLNSKTDQDILLEPVEAAFEFNGFGRKDGKRRYDVWFRNYLVSTLDTGAATQQSNKAGNKKPQPQPDKEAA